MAPARFTHFVTRQTDWTGLCHRGRAGLCVRAFSVALMLLGATCSPLIARPAGDPRIPAAVPAGTVLHLRLEAAVSTRASRLGDAVTASVVREVPSPGEEKRVAIPLGARVRGQVGKLHKSSKPTERDLLRVDFTELAIPGRETIAIRGLVVEVENARESVVPDGTIRGILADELPLTHVERALEALKETDPKLAADIRKAQEVALGKPDTSIELPAGTELRWMLSEPLAIDHGLPSATPGSLSARAVEAVGRLLEQAPQRAVSKEGAPGDPLNLVLIGTAEEIRRAFLAAGWTAAQKLTGLSVWETARAVVIGAGYESAPVSPLFVFGRPEDLAFQKTLNTFAKRHHLRLWRSSAMTPEGHEIWLGAATHDVGWDLRPAEGVVSHAIDPEIDKEREKVAADLVAADCVRALQLVTRPDPLTAGTTATGAPWRTDGRLLAVELQPLARGGAF